MIIESSAPSNIALIKYMGKTDAATNRPANSSLSWTLEHLRTYVRIQLRDDLLHDEWAPLESNSLAPLALSEKGRHRYLQHFAFLKSEWNIKENFLIESANNFPSDCGLASSASSFAALTKAATDLFQQVKFRNDVDLKKVANYSRQGSGSSCRSFFSPWSIWDAENVFEAEFPFKKLYHQVVIVESAQKLVSSSEAHKRVASSLNFQGRIARADQRLKQLAQAFRDQNWPLAFEICWAEFWDMHSLFETSQPSFGYLNPESIAVLKKVRDLWRDQQDGPLVTMDAGPNVHLLYREDQKDLAMKVGADLLKGYTVFSSEGIRGELQ